MKFFDDLLDKIDNYYVGKSQKDRIYSYIMAGGGVAFVIYILTYDITAAMYKKAEKERTKILTELKNDQRFLKMNSADNITFLQNQNSLNKKRFAEIKRSSDYIDYKISQLQPLIYNETAWGKFIDSISETARKNGIRILNLKNLFVTKRENFGHVLDIEVGFSGSFHDTLRFINTLEKTPLVVDIHDMEMVANSTLTTKLKIAVWGISY